MRVAAIFLFCLVPNIAVGFQAAPVTQLSDRAAWQHVTVGRTDVSFVGLGGNSGLDRWYPGGINVNGVTFTGAPYVGTTDYLYIRSDPNFLFGPPDGDLGCPQQIPCGNSGAGITVSLPKGVNSVGLDLASFWPAGPVNVVFRNNQTFTIGNPQTLQGSVFAGFTSPTPIDSFIIEAPGLPIVRDMSFGTHDVAASPLISVGGIVPVYGSTAVVAPGAWISIFGVNLASASQLWQGDFPTVLGDAAVTIDGRPAFLSYVSSTQINAQVPDDATRGTVQVMVTNSLGTATSTVKLADFSPSFCLLDANHIAAIILRHDGSGAYGGGVYDILGPGGNTLGFPTVPAKAGDEIALYAVGLGSTFPSLPAGKSFSGALPTTNPVRLEIGNSPLFIVNPSFAGLNSAGLYQINFTLPTGLGNGDQPLTARVNGTPTQSGVVISVQ